MYGGRLRTQGTVDELLAIHDSQLLEVEPLKPKTIEKIEKLLQKEENKSIRKVETPRQKLESLFLSVVEKAEKEGLQTSGATGGGRMADFLAEELRDEAVDLEAMAPVARATGTAVAASATRIITAPAKVIWRGLNGLTP